MMPAKKARKLSPKQEAFVNEYVIDFNATQAAIRAGYNAKNADRVGPKLVGKSCVSAAIQAKQAALSERAELSAEWILEQLKKEATLTGDGSSHAGRVKALELLGKRLKMWTDKVETTQTGILRITEVVVNASGGERNRAEQSPA